MHVANEGNLNCTYECVSNSYDFKRFNMSMINFFFFLFIVFFPSFHELCHCIQKTWIYSLLTLDLHILILCISYHYSYHCCCCCWCSCILKSIVIIHPFTYLFNEKKPPFSFNILKINFCISSNTIRQTFTYKKTFKYCVVSYNSLKIYVLQQTRFLKIEDPWHTQQYY